MTKIESKNVFPIAPHSSFLPQSNVVHVSFLLTTLFALPFICPLALPLIGCTGVTQLAVPYDDVEDEPSDELQLKYFCPDSLRWKRSKPYLRKSSMSSSAFVVVASDVCCAVGT